jgi:peptidoglycan/LPS O-acetylase OafA/YrhL
LSTSLRYRPYIDGLRAVAVLAVVVYHANQPWLPGGFIGVDVFFVISGFLISRIIYTEIAENSFSLTRFYERRARRILPAFVVVTALTAIGVYYLFLPAELVNFARSVIAAVLFSANNYFYWTTDYFAPTAHSLPILHYWSLGVEEQFYLLFPLLLMVAARRLNIGWIMSTLFFASLALSEIVVRTNPPAAFYLLPFRGFELIIGSLLALPGMRFAHQRSVATAATFGGLILIGAAAITFRSDMRFPGLSALLPTLGAGLVLWGSDKAANMGGDILSARLFTFVGRISYSLYLVHWPLILFADRVAPYTDRSIKGACVIALSMVLAWLSYRYVEQPFRTRRLATGLTYRLSAVSLAALTATSLIVVSFKGFPGRLDSTVSEILAFEHYDLKPQFRSRVCFLDPDQPASEINYDVCLPKSPLKQVILWGDSVAAHLYVGLKGPLESAGYSLGQLTASGCPPAVGLDVAGRPNCAPFNQGALARVLHERPDMVILASGYLWSASDALFAGLDKTIKALNGVGIKTIILGAPPLYRASVPAILAERMKVGDSNPLSGQDLAPGFTLEMDVALEKRFLGRHDVRYVSIMKTVCPNNQCPLLFNQATPSNFDPLHLTPAGSKYFAAILAPHILSASF